MFLSSHFVPSAVSPARRTDTLASTRSDPFSRSQSEAPVAIDGRAQQRQEAAGLRAVAEVGLGDDLEQRRAGSG